ncbi:MAG: histidine phosphatase family protein [Neisseriaceae bacterium]|nr:histidine phosphatase family protein [Neisseriaceae bacterium]
MMNVYLVRHGETEFNIAKRIQGWSDSPLTEKGKEKVAQTGQLFQAAHIQFDAAFCSTSFRAEHTTNIILDAVQQNHLNINKLDELREFHFGQFEGKDGNDLHRLLAKQNGFGDDVHAWLKAYRYGNQHLLAQSIQSLDASAENEQLFHQRLQRAWYKIIGQGLPESNILVVSHGMSIVAMLKAIDAQSTIYKSPPNASVTHLTFSPQQGLRLQSKVGEALLDA